MASLNASDMLDSRVLPSMAKYSTIVPLGLESTAAKRVFMPLNAGVFALNGNNNIIRINISDGSAFLDTQLSTLAFQLKNNGAGTISIDNSYHSIFKRVRVISNSSSQDIEDIRFYSTIHSLLSNLKRGPNARLSLQHEGYGSNGNYVPARPAVLAQVNAGAAVAIAAVDAYAGVSAKNIGHGELLIAGGQTVNVQLSLMSSVK